MQSEFEFETQILYIYYISNRDSVYIVSIYKIYSKWINLLYTGSIYTFTVRCMTHHPNLNLKLKYKIYSKWINLPYTDSVYTFTVRCMTYNPNLNLKLKFYISVVYPIVVVYTPLVYIKFTQIKS